MSYAVRWATRPQRNRLRARGLDWISRELGRPVDELAELTEADARYLARRPFKRSEGNRDDRREH